MVASLCAAACGSGSDAGARQPAPYAPTTTAASSSVTGTIGNQPFYARAAYLLPSKRWSDGVSRTTVFVLQKPVNCRDLLGTEPVVLPGEYMVRIEFLASWPVHPGSVWVSKLGGQSKSDTDVGEIAFVTQGTNGGHSGTFIAGQVQVLESTPNGGVLSMRAANDPNDPFLRGADEATRQRIVGIGAVSGSIPFTMCPR